ncbi:hypothetical protein C6A86_026965 [Mycobacterium sp. ITM-2016-00316]|uniref:hypothetical protein n=1 Tax=Mycobacterium sp. ITM-2016-00316 TaxID=2099695 RepID=UPI00287FCC24|nr:hypothetical protein [Mycobacterium sp. ITM-2016-00316]WNG81752.1 hypothetical protein C6A86_026965 [Mycobacterium sp. ITM-2016-00316]
MTAILAASVTAPTMPTHVESTHTATLASRAPQTLQVHLASFVEQALEQALTPPVAQVAGDGVATHGAALKTLPANATTAATRPPVGYSPYYPFTTPTTPLGSLGWWVTLPIAIPGLVLDSLAQSWTRDLTDKGIDARLANQPELLSRYLLVPIAVTIQTALTGLIGGGTVELGKFTLPQAVFWSAKSLRMAIANTIAAEKDLLNGGTGVLPDYESATADRSIALSALEPATAATATTKPRVAKRPVPPAHPAQPPTSTTPTADTSGDSDTDASLSQSSPTEKTPTGRTDRLRLGPISLPSPFTRSRAAADPQASPSTRQAGPERRLAVRSAMSDRG